MTSGATVIPDDVDALVLALFEDLGPVAESRPVQPPPALSDEKRAPSASEAFRAQLAATQAVDPIAWFDSLARELLGRYRLRAGQRTFRLLELEFYLHAAGHEDPAVHRNRQQLATCAHWYFHREKAARLGFTRKGLDLTFGRPGVDYGGILIRAIRPEGEAGPLPDVEGPSCVVDAILRATGTESVLHLYERPGFTFDALAQGLLRLEPAPAPFSGEARVGPRVGLRLAPLSAAPYRYRAAASSAKKERRSLLEGRRLVLGPQAPGSAR